MRIKIIATVAAAAVLSACGGSDSKISNAGALSAWAKAELFYSFPYHGQENVSLNAPLVLRFSDPVAGDLNPSNVKLKCEEGPCENNTTGQQGDVVQWRTGEPDVVDGDRGLVLYTAHELMANSKYCVEFDGLSLTRGAANAPSNGFCFNTRVAPDKRGSLAEYGATGELEVAKTFPALDGSTEPIMDFSTFRVRFNQPIKDTKVRYGHEVVLKQGDKEVDATLLVKRNLMTIAPKQTLTAGEQYTLTLQNLEGLYTDASLGEKVYTFTPEDSQPRTILAQDTVEAVEGGSLLPAPCAEGGAELSVLTDQPINCVPMESVLLGDKDSTMQYGDVFAELAFLRNFAEVSPLRVPRGSLLAGTNIDVKVAGIINPNGDKDFSPEEAAEIAGLMKTGKVSVSFVSDATGYIYSNPYSSDPAAPKQVKLFMDVAMTAEGISPNASLSQDLLHVELNGMASLDEKSMVIDAVGIVEPDVLGTEVAFGFLSFQMKSYPQAEMADVFKTQGEDRGDWEQFAVGPAPQSVFPDPGTLYASGEAPGFLSSDAITVHFNGPLDPSSIIPGDTFTLAEQGTLLAEEDIDWYLDGASFVVKRVGGFKADTEYELEIFGESKPSANGNEMRGLPFPKIEEDNEAGPARRYFETGENGEFAEGKPINFGGNVAQNSKLTFKTAKFDDGTVSGQDLAYDGHISDEGHQPKPFHYPAILTAYPGYPCAVSWTVGVGSEKAGHCLGDVAGEESKVIIRPQHLPSNRPIRLTFSKPVKVGEGALVVREDASNEKVDGRIIQNGFDVSFIPEKPWKPGVLYKYEVKTAFNGDCDAIICGTNGEPLITAPLAVQVPAEAPINEAPAFVNSEMFFFGAHKTKTVFQALRNTPTLDPAAVMTYHGDMNDKAGQAIAQDGDDTEFPNSTKLEFDHANSQFMQKIIKDAKVGCLEGSCPDKNYIHLSGNLNSEIYGPVDYQCLYKDAEGNEAEYCNEPTDIDRAAVGGAEPLLQVGGQALAVGIYPTAILAGSVDVFAEVGLTGSFLDDLIKWLVDIIAGTDQGWLPAPTGVQIMRMHPTTEMVEPEAGNPIANHPLYKNNPNGLIPGWIRNSSEGPVFETRVNLYLDAPYLSVLDGTGSHNQHNYELTLDLRGPVEFLGDGRIVINQRNLNAETVVVELGDLTLDTEGEIHLNIPEGGAYMMYQGEPVKE